MKDVREILMQKARKYRKQMEANERLRTNPYDLKEIEKRVERANRYFNKEKI